MVTTATHRPCCTGAYIAPAVGSCYQHYKNAETGITIYENITRRLDYHDTVDPAGVPPYERFKRNYPSEYSCIPADPWCHGEAGAPPNTPYCDLPDWEADQIPCQGSQLSVTNGRYYNCFRATTGTTSFATCRKLGFKNVFAKKVWQGRQSYTSRDSMGVAGPFADEMTWCGYCTKHYEDTAIDPVKYRTIVGSSSYTFYNDFLGVSYSGTATATTSVGRYGGVTSSCATGASAPAGMEFIYASYALGLFERGANHNHCTVQASFSAIVNGSATFYGLKNLYGNPTSIEGEGNCWTLTWAWDHTFEGGNTENVIGEVVTVCGSELSWDSYYANQDNSAWVQTRRSRITYTATSFLYDSWFQAGTASANDLIYEYCEAHLSDPYYESEVREDLTTLLNTWDLTDDVRYPWRTDTNVIHGPLVTYDEQYEGFPFPDCAPSGQGHPPDPAFSAEIVGAPIPFSGADRFWNDRHENWEVCNDPFDGHEVYYISSYGAWSNTNGIPASATQWTNKRQTDFFPEFPQYAHLRYADPVLYGSKWAEIQIQRPSINFARPFGSDRFQLDPDSARCIKSIEGNTVILEDATANPPTFNTGDVCYVCDGAGNNGVWKVTKVSTYVFTLDTLLFSGARLADLGVTPQWDCGSGMMVKLRWLLSNIHPIVGQVSISDVTATNPINVYTTVPTALMSGDRVYIREVAGLPRTNGWKTVLTSGDDANHIMLSGTSGSGFGPYISGGYIEDPFAPDAFWNDEQSKGEFCYKTWGTNFRDVGEYQRIKAENDWLTGQGFDCDTFTPCEGSSVPSEPRPYQAQWGLSQEVTGVSCETHCIPFTPCYPSVMCISPNTDAFPNGKTFPFTANFTCDVKYGSLWAGEIQQDRYDPFYQYPACPCKAVIDEYSEETEYYTPITCREDDGSCKQDEWTLNGNGDQVTTIKYFPHGPMVECRCSMPDITGAPLLPKLPSGIYLGCLSQEQINVPNQPQGNVCSYPSLGSAVRYPWVIYLNELQCVCDQGRFYTSYEDNRVRCRGNQLVTPTPTPEE